MQKQDLQMAVPLLDKFVVRNATEGELDVAIRLGVTVLPEWHVSPSEFACAYALDPTGFYVGVLNGEIISLINCIKYPGHSAFISTFLVKEEYRGKGYGRQTWDTAWKSLNKSISLGLDAVTDMVPKYETLGFRSFWNTLVVVLDLKMITEKFAGVSDSAVCIKPINAIDVTKVIEYDASIFGTSREGFTRAWISIPGSRGWVAINERGSLIGYIAIRPVISGIDMKVGPLSLGPLYADSNVIAKLLLKAMAESYIADTTTQETQVEMLCCDGGEYGDHGLQTVAGVEARPPIVIGPRMYTNGIPPGRQLHKIYGIMSPAFD